MAFATPHVSFTTQECRPRAPGHFPRTRSRLWRKAPLAATPRCTTQWWGFRHWSQCRPPASISCDSLMRSCPLFIALAVVCVGTWSKRSFLLLCRVVGIDADGHNLGGVVNPNGPEVCEAICVWVSRLIILERADDAGQCADCDITAVNRDTRPRGLSPLWAVLDPAHFGIPGRAPANNGSLAHALAAIVLRCITACGIAAVPFIVAAHSNVLRRAAPCCRHMKRRSTLSSTSLDSPAHGSSR